MFLKEGLKYMFESTIKDDGDTKEGEKKSRRWRFD